MIGRLVSIVCLLGMAGLIALAWGRLPREVTVSSYATSLNGRSFSQRHNAALAMKQIDSKVLLPHEIFSFNQAVGSYSRDEGYRKAPVSYDGKLIDEWGGGVCQASTTLYNAALQAGLTILERTHHQFCPTYVKPGHDAAVAYPSIDLKLVNPYDFPIRIHAFINVDKSEVDLIAGRRLPNPVTVSTQTFRSLEPATFRLRSSNGGHRLRTSGRPGYEARVLRTIGNREEVVSFDEYPVMNRVLEISGR